MPAVPGSRDAAFRYDDAVLLRYPTIRAGIVHAARLSNGPSAPGLRAAYRATQRTAADRLRETPIAELPSVAAWRRAFTTFGAKPTQYRNAVEALLRRLAKHGDVPGISTLVDIGNLVSIRHAMPIAVLDVARIAGAITVRFADGTEEFTDLAATAAVHPDAGEVIYVDGEGVVSSRRWCWRQSASSATSPTTTEALIVVEGLHDTAREDIGAALTDLRSLLATYQPDSRTSAWTAGADVAPAPAR